MSATTLPSTAPAYLTVREAAAILHVNIKTIYAAIDAGSIKAVRFGRTIRIPKDQFATLGAQ
jgi:excisionase family DNA binding protein